MYLYRLSQMTPLVNGVKSCSIYSQRLSPITVVEKILQYEYFMFHYCSEGFIHHRYSLFLFSFLSNSCTGIQFINCFYNIRCIAGGATNFQSSLISDRVCDNFHGHCVCNNFHTVVNRNPNDSGICASIGSEPRRNSLQPNLNSNVLSFFFFFVLCVCMFVFGS